MNNFNDEVCEYNYFSSVTENFANQLNGYDPFLSPEENAYNINLNNCLQKCNNLNFMDKSSCEFKCYPNSHSLWI
jgi:hypothetical protein